MEEFASLLIDFGIDFQYENYGSQGEEIKSFSSGIEIKIYEGKYYFTYCGLNAEYDFNDEDSIKKILKLVQDACIEETT